MCVLAVHNKAQAQIISNREFKLWTILQGTTSRVATFHAVTCVMSQRSLSRQATKSEARTAVEFAIDAVNNILEALSMLGRSTNTGLNK